MNPSDVTTALAVGGALVALAAGAKGLWSPCGLSMLSTLTPLGERGRGHRYAPAAAWFVVGAIAGGLCLGAALAGLAALVAAAHTPPAVRATLALVAATVALTSDSPAVPVSLPIHHRQVNERWLDHYRTWVYGAGFGWQIGTGFATYITSAGVFLLVVLAVLTGQPWLALAIGTLHGAVRGLGVFVSARIKTPNDLLALHRRLSTLAPFAQAAVLVAESIVIAATIATFEGVPVAVPIALGTGLAAFAAWTAARVSTAPSGA
jgi:hypothetical protein